MHNKETQHEYEHELSASRINLISHPIVQYIPKEESEVGRGEIHFVFVEEEDMHIREDSVKEKGGGVVKLSSRQGRKMCNEYVL